MNTSEEHVSSVVVNVRVQHIRPTYQNLREWVAEQSNVYIGRGKILIIDGMRFPPQNSNWANPFKIKKDGTLQEVLEKYRVYMRNRLLTEPELRLQLKNLNGKKLGCWCKPQPCHGDVLLELMGEFS
jgi:Domain of unknown function (DUF4326)